MFKAPGLSTISLGPIEIQVWGTLVGLGFLIGYFYGLKRAKIFGFPKNHLQNLTLVIIATSVVGARLMYFILFPQEFKTFFDIFMINHGGMAFWGGFLLAGLGVVVYLGFLAKKKRLGMGFLEMLGMFCNVVAPAVAIGYGIGRVGCFLTDLHPGIPTNLPWGVEYEGVIRHPTSLYSSLAGFFIFGILIGFERREAGLERGKRDGRIGLLFILLFSTYRFLLDFLRAEDLNFDPRFWGLTVPQIASLILLLISSVIIVWKKRLKVIQ